MCLFLEFRLCNVLYVGGTQELQPQKNRTDPELPHPLQGKFLTYRELNDRANQLARFLEANGVKAEQPVGVMLERSLELMVAMLAVLKAGGAFVPMDPEYPADRLAIMAEDAEVPLPPSCLASHSLI